MTDPPAVVGTSRGAVERWDQCQMLAAAVHDLYRACHFPPPRVVVAPSALEFVRLVLTLGRSWWPPFYLLLVFVLSSLLMFGLSIQGLYEILEYGLTLHSAALFPVLLVVSVAAVASYPLGRLGPAPLLSPEVVIGVAGPTLLAAGLGLALGGSALAVAAAMLGCAFAGVLHVLLASVTPFHSRWAIRQTYQVPVPLCRARVLHDVISARLRAAGDELPEASTAGRGRPVQRERPELGARIEADGLRLNRIGWFELRPLLGAGCARTEQFLLRHAVERVGDADHLPHLLRAAWTVHCLTDAATLLDGVAIVLPADAPLVPGPASHPKSWRRSTRSPYREVLAIAQDGPWLGLGIDAAWSDDLADRLLARNVVRLPDAGLRHAAVRAIGMDRFVAAARLRPVQRDHAGELYLIGPSLDPLAFVRVTDASPGPDGTARRHWLSVPPHVATAHEGVAWTFGLAEHEYTPKAET